MLAQEGSSDPDGRRPGVTVDGAAVYWTAGPEDYVEEFGTWGLFRTTCCGDRQVAGCRQPGHLNGLIGCGIRLAGNLDAAGFETLSHARPQYPETCYLPGSFSDDNV